MEQRFGIRKMKARKKCMHWQCTKPSDVVIGDVKQPYASVNYCLCETHARQLMKDLEEMYGATPIETASTGVSQGNLLLDSVLKGIYNANGKVVKADLVKICTDNGIELPVPVEEVKIKQLLELISPELKGEETNV